MNKGKILIAYFSRAGNNYISGNIVNLPVGNTEVAAKMIQSKTGGEMFRIDPVKKYSDDYKSCGKEAYDELRANARPELSSYLEDISEYDMLILGYPNWCETMPMPVFTFLERYDFSDKIILPFCTNEGSGMGRSEDDIKKLCPQSKVLKGLSIRGGSVRDADAIIDKWLKQSGF